MNFHLNGTSSPGVGKGTEQPSSDPSEVSGIHSSRSGAEYPAVQPGTGNSPGPPASEPRLFLCRTVIVRCVAQRANHRSGFHDHDAAVCAVLDRAGNAVGIRSGREARGTGGLPVSGASGGCAGKGVSRATRRFHRIARDDVLLRFGQRLADQPTD